MVHPTKDELNLFVGNRLTDLTRVRLIEAHIAVCEFCSEYYDLCLLEEQLLAEAAEFRLSDNDRQVAVQIYRQAMAGHIVPLNVLHADQFAGRALLAADGKSDAQKTVTNLATLYSEDPELVLRVMRDAEKGTDYLQLIGEDSELTAHVMIRIPEMGKEYVTDVLGKAVVPRGELGDAESLNWEIKLPDARFELKPMVYDPEHVESLQEVILETEQHDRIQVTFASKTAGKQILIKVLELDGITDFGSVRVSISQQAAHEVRNVAPHQVVPFAIVDPSQEINIRLYR